MFLDYIKGVNIMKAFCEVIAFNLSDVITTSNNGGTGNDCELYSGGTGTECQGDDDC